MKKLFLLVVSVTFVFSSFCQSADEVINKFVVASGGKEKLSSIKTLQYLQTINMKTPMGDIAVPLQFFREKNKFFRMQASMQLGPQNIDFFTIVTDTAGYIKLPAMPMLGSEGGLQKMEEKDRAFQTFQFDPAGMFSGLVDYAAKGNKVELLKEDTVNNEPCYQIRFILPSGDDMIYFISKATNLVVRTDIKGEIAASMSGMGGMMGGMGNQAEKAQVSLLYSDYQDIKGIKFPAKAVMKNQMGDADCDITNIKIDEPIEAKWYKAE